MRNREEAGGRGLINGSCLAARLAWQRVPGRADRVGLSQADLLHARG